MRLQPEPPKAEKAEADSPALTSGKIENDMSKCILCGLCVLKLLQML